MIYYICSDGEVDIEIEASNPRKAAEKYAADRTYDVNETTYVTVYVSPSDITELEDRMVGVIGNHTYSEHSTGW